MEQRDPLELDALALFVKIVDAGSLTAAGRVVGLPKATISRRLADLERSLGVPLLRRTTRRNSLTAPGRALYDRVATHVREAELAAQETRSLARTDGGMVRMSAATAFGQVVLLPLLTRYQATSPNVRIDLSLSDGRVRVVEEGYDLAIRMGPLDGSELGARKLLRCERRVVASPGYLAKHGTPTTLEDLSRHAAVGLGATGTTWSLIGADGPVRVRVKAILTVDAMLAVAEAVKLGAGIGILPSFLADPSVATGELIALDLGASPAPAEATALFPRAVTPSRPVKQLVAFLVRELRDIGAGASGRP